MLPRLLFLTPLEERANDSIKIAYPGTELTIKRASNEGYNLVVRQFNTEQGENKDVKVEREIQLSRENVLHLQLYTEEFLRSTFRIDSRE